MATPLHNQKIGRPVTSLRHRLRCLTDRASEWFWFLLSFTLFVVLGPFSAPIVVIVLFKLGLENSEHLEPESIAAK